MEKLNLHSTGELVRFAIRKGLVDRRLRNQPAIRAVGSRPLAERWRRLRGGFWMLFLQDSIRVGAPGSPTRL